MSAGFLFLLLAGAASIAGVADDAPPAAFKRYLPRGRIPSLDEPRFVPAQEARIPADAWVLGVVLKGEARAYDLNLMTRHEVVNDRIGGEPVAAVWCPLANTAVVFDRRVAGRELRFEPSGVLLGGSIVMQDKETDSFWPLLQPEAAYGPLKGAPLDALPVSKKTRFADWVREHPDTVVLSVGGREHMERNPLEPYLASSYGFRGTVAEDTRLPTKEPVFGFEREGTRYAARAREAEGGGAFRVGDRHLFLYRPRGAALNVDTAAFLSERGFTRRGEDWVETGTGARFEPARRAFTGGVVAPLRGVDTFWYVWSLNFPGSVLLAAAP